MKTPNSKGWYTASPTANVGFILLDRKPHWSYRKDRERTARKPTKRDTPQEVLAKAMALLASLGR